MPFDTILQYMIDGFSGTPDLTRTGIVSSTSQSAAFAGNTFWALWDNSQVGAMIWPVAGANGVAVDNNSVIGKYTYFGDMNVDGQVTGDDYTVIDSNLNTNPDRVIAWISGDANLDGSVTGDDYTTIDSNLGLGAANPL